MAFDYDFRIRIAAPRPTVFERLLRIEHLARWFCGWSRIEPKVGGSFKFGGETCIVQPEGKGWETTIDEGDVLRRFAFTWPIRGARTRVTYGLEDYADDATILSARHLGVPMKDTTCGTVQDAWRMCLGNLKSIAEGRGDSVRPDHCAAEPPEMRLSALIEATPGVVFAALTDPGEVDRWSTGGVPRGKAQVEPRVGGAFALGHGESADRILELKPDHSIVFQSAGTGPNLRTAIELEAKASGTAVYLRSTGYRADAGPQILRDRGRWSDRLVGLKNHVESGDAGFQNSYEAQLREA
ncbi:MAG: SRPBCC domain-containing protein [Thermoplasmata archaeon]|nr:SRPBCC domain-containing protein [Thermoplasmata archaeon]